MGIFGRIRGFFSSCFRPSTPRSSNNEENRRLVRPTVDTLRGNSSRHVAVESRSNDSSNNASTSHYESTATSTIAARQLDTKPRYFLSTFICRLNSPQKGNGFTPASEIVYCGEWIACTAIILDEFSRRLRPQHTVEITSCGDSRVDFRECKLENGCFQFMMKAFNAKNITICFNVRNYPDLNTFTLRKEIQVRYNPCSTVQAEMTIKKIDESRNECLFQVSVVDVCGSLSSRESCKLDVLSHCRKNDVIQKQMHSKQGNTYFDITVKGEQAWSRDLIVTLNGELVPKVEKIEVFDKLKGLCLSAIKDGDYESIPDFIGFYGTRIFIPLSTGDDDGKFFPYAEANCKLLPGPENSYKLLCKNVKEDDILGSGFAHINNIRRALGFKGPDLDVHEIPAEKMVIIDLSNLHYHHLEICKIVVQHLLRGLYYRQKASQADTVRLEWKNRISSIVKLIGASPSVRLCKIFRDHFSNLITQYNREACDELFKFFNFQRDESSVDLHGLLVADEKKLEMLRMDLSRGSVNDEEISKLFQKCKLKSFNGRNKQALKNELLDGKFPASEVKDFVKFCRENGVNQKKLNALERDLLRRSERSEEVDALIQKFRSERDEAVRKLKETLESFDLEKASENNTPWLEIIVGAGHHSRVKNQQNIRPKVEKLLKERRLGFAAVNKGSLVVTFKSYSGPQPCFGEYYCENCDRCWKSSKSYVGKYQKCSNCNVNCWPVKQRQKERDKNYRHHGARPVKRQSRPQQPKYSQRRKEFGRPRNASEEECVIIQVQTV